MSNENISILSIDDDEQIRLALRAVFDSQHWTSYLAEDVEQGRQIFLTKHVDIILIDYHLPKINGLDGVRMLRQISANVPIIVFTIDEKQSVADEFLKAGASDFALKPIKAPDIIFRIRLHIRLMNSSSRQSELPDDGTKGISPATLELILEYLHKEEQHVTVEQVAEGTGLACQTAYRYLQYLYSEKKLDIVSQYGKIGRPKQCYRLNEKNDYFRR